MRTQVPPSWRVSVSVCSVASELLDGWQGWWTSGVFRPGSQRFQWGTGEYIDDNNKFWGFKKSPYDGTCVWVLQLRVYNHTWGNYDCDTHSGFVCEIVLE